MSYKEVIRKPLVCSLLFGLYVVVESYLLSTAIFFVMPKLWVYGTFVENVTAVLVTSTIADFIFNRLSLRLRRKLVIAVVIIAATLLLQALILAAFYFLPIP